MGRRKKCETCYWITYNGRSNKIKETCYHCGDVFPCASDCGHFDCADHKVVRCFSCGKKVAGPEYNLIAGGGTGCYFVHAQCVDPSEVLMTVRVDEV